MYISDILSYQMVLRVVGNKDVWLVGILGIGSCHSGHFDERLFNAKRSVFQTRC